MQRNDGLGVGIAGIDERYFDAFACEMTDKAYGPFWIAKGVR